MILAIDPGNIQSAYVIVDDDYSIHGFGKIKNNELKEIVRNTECDELVIEMIACYGMPVGKEVFDTCIFIGNLAEIGNFNKREYIYRREEKIALCGKITAKDSNIRQALIDRFAKYDFKNGKGTKKQPDTFYGFKADIWAAYAVAVTYLDKKKGVM